MSSTAKEAKKKKQERKIEYNDERVVESDRRDEVSEGRREVKTGGRWQKFRSTLLERHVYLRVGNSLWSHPIDANTWI